MPDQPIIRRSNQQVTLDELLAHVDALAGAVAIPMNVDAERCFADDPAGVARTVELVADAGAAGCSIEEYDPRDGSIDTLEVAVERVGAAADAATERGIVLAMRQGPAVPELAAMGVRRVSTGGGLARAAYGALATAARELRAAGTSTYLDAAIPGADLEATFDSDRSSP